MNIKNLATSTFKLIKKMYKIAPKLCVISNVMIFKASAITVYHVIFPQLILRSLLGNNFKALFYNISFYLLVSLADNLITCLHNIYTNKENEKVNAKIIDEFILLSKEKEYANFENIDFINEFVFNFENITSLMHGSLNILNNFLKALLTVIFIISFIPMYNFGFLLLIVVISVLQQKLSVTISVKKFKLGKLLNSLNRKINYIYKMFYDVNYTKDVQVNQRHRQILDKKNDFTGLIIQNLKEKVPGIEILSGLNSLVGVLEYLSFAIYFGIITIKGLAGIDSYFTNLNAYQSLKNSVMSIFGIWTVIKSNGYLIDSHIKFKEMGIAKKDNLLEIKEDDIDTIEFINVFFKYPNTDKFVLNDLSFKLEKDELVAIVGNNGSGKSTIFKLILGLYRPTAGQILVNGVDLKNIDFTSHISKISCMLQENTTYPFTIKDLFNNIEISPGDSIFEDFGLATFIDKLPKYLDTPITSQLYDGGVELSGGQWQKLKLAIFFKNKKSLRLLDEPTNNLDIYAETKLYEKLFASNKGNITLIISHSLTGITKFKKILILEDGYLVASGSHEELINNNHKYQKIYDMGQP